MNKYKAACSGFIVFCVTASGLGAQGLLGERYSAYDLGYERLSGFDSTLKGVTMTGEINAPFPIGEPDFGVDFNGEVGFTRLTGGGATFEVFDVAARTRAHMPLAHHEGIQPYGEIGLGWARYSVDDGPFGSDDSFTFPIGIGVELDGDPFVVTPFFEYTVMLDSNFSDPWSVGTTAAYWFPNEWGTRATVAYTDWGRGLDSVQATIGIVFPY